MKTTEELNAIKARLEALNEKLSSLTEDELNQVAGGDYWDNKYSIYPFHVFERRFGTEDSGQSPYRMSESSPKKYC